MKIYAQVVLSTLFCFTSSSCIQQQRTPSLYIIPSGYVGQVRIFYDQKDAPPLREANGFIEWIYRSAHHQWPMQNVRRDEKRLG